MPCHPGYIETDTGCVCNRDLKLIVRCDDLGRYFYVQVKWITDRQQMDR